MPHCFDVQQPTLEDLRFVNEGLGDVGEQYLKTRIYQCFVGSDVDFLVLSPVCSRISLQLL